MSIRWLKREQKWDYLWLGLFSLLLGLAISATMGLHYVQIRGSHAENYIEFGMAGLLRGIGFAVPVFFLLLLLTAGCERAKGFLPGAAGRRLSERGFFFAIWGVLVLCWAPWLMSYYPGGIVGDGAHALENALGSDPMENHWVIAYILVLRVFLNIGKWFSEDVNVGVFLYVIFSCCMYAAACSAVITTLRRKGVPRVLLVVFTFMYAFFGHFASYSMTLWKDGLFSAGVTELALLLWREPEGRGVAGRKAGTAAEAAVVSRTGEKTEKPLVWALKTGAILLFLCLWRNFVGYGILATGLLLLIIRRKQRLTAILMILIAAASFIIQGPVYNAIGVDREGDTVEALAIPIQQTAAAIGNGAELTEEQSELLYAILPREQWLEYTPLLCDTIKFEMNERVLKENMGAFLRTWAQLAPKNLGTYTEAWLLETLGYWQPYGSNRGNYYDYFTGIQDLYGQGYESRDLMAEAVGFSLKDGMNGRREFVPSGTAVWMMLLCLALVLCRKEGRKKKLAVLLPFLMIWAGVLVSAPIAYSYRYVQMAAIGLPVFVTLPLIREDGAAAAGEAKKSGRVAALLDTRKAARIAGAVLAAVLLAVTLGGGRSIRKFTIMASGSEYNADDYVVSGLSGNEGGFSWTDGEEMAVRIPYAGESGTVQVTIKVIGTFNGRQAWEIRDGDDEYIADGALEGAGEIVFPLELAGRETMFRLVMPDAVRVSEVWPEATDPRQIAFQIERIDGEVQ